MKKALRHYRHGFLAMLILLVSFLPEEAHASSTCGGITNLILVTTTAVSFGMYSANTNSPANGNVTVQCTVTLGNVLPSFTVALSAGGAGNFSPRKMGFLGQTLNYNLYTSGSFGTVWGDGTGATSMQTYNASSNLATAPFTVYGLLPQNQFPTPGLYTDSIVVTVTF